MPKQTWVETLIAAVASGTAVASTASETIIFPDTTIPANTMDPKRSIQIVAYGELSTTGTPTMIFGIRWGGVAGVLLCKSAAITTGSGASHTMWWVDVYITCRTDGTGGTFMANGQCVIEGSSSPPTHLMSAGGATTPATASCDTTIDKLLSITATWSASSSSNTLTGTNLYVIQKN